MDNSIIVDNIDLRPLAFTVATGLIYSLLKFNSISSDKTCRGLANHLKILSKESKGNLQEKDISLIPIKKFFKEGLMI